MTKVKTCDCCTHKKQILKLEKNYREISRDVLTHDKKIQQLTKIISAQSIMLSALLYGKDIA